MELLPGGVGEVRQSEVIAALSHALDMTEGHPVGQAERSCLIGMRLAHELRLGEEERYALYYALLLKDVAFSIPAARASTQRGSRAAPASRRAIASASSGAIGPR